MEILTFKIEDFEGPLDVLLYLVSKNKMSLYDVPILELIDQYTALLQSLQENRMEVASEFIEMAARLVQMKSVLLLPRSEEAERMKEELTGQLIEYEACKRVAAQLGEKSKGVYHLVRSPQPAPVDATYRLHHDPSLLESAWNALMGRNLRKKPPKQETFEPLVTAPFVSVASGVVHVLRGLVSGRVRQLRQLFHRGESRSHSVATFLAVLELIRAGRIQLDEEETIQLTEGRVRAVEEKA